MNHIARLNMHGEVPTPQRHGIQAHMNQHVEAIVGMQRHGIAGWKNRLDLSVGRGNHSVSRRLDGNALSQEPVGKRLVGHIRQRQHAPGNRR